MGALKITVTCGHIYHRGMWVMHCPKLAIETKPLGVPKGADKEDAFAAAIAFVRAELRALNLDAENL